MASPYLPVDSWVYPAVLRLYSLGYVDHVFLGMRPWTRSSVLAMLEETAGKLQDACECVMMPPRKRERLTRRYCAN